MAIATAVAAFTSFILHRSSDSSQKAGTTPSSNSTSTPSTSASSSSSSSLDLYRLVDDEAALAATSRSLRSHKASPTSGFWYTAAAFIAFNHFICFLVPFFSYPSSSLSSSSPWYYLPYPSPLLLFFFLFQTFLNLLGITAGYHRLWSHRAYEASVPLRIFLSIIGLQAFQGSASWWVKRHRLHHRFTDTQYDPYDSTKGLFYSHIGWLFQPPPHFSKLTLIGMKDVEADPVVRYQKKYLLIGYIVFGAILPSIQGWMICGNAMAGLIWIGFFSRLVSWHGIWCINSLAHWSSTPSARKSFSLRSSAVHTPLFALIMNGEGHHNYHHEFPTDYRHGIHPFDYDPTKWFIQLCIFFKLAYNEKKTNENMIQQAKYKVLKEELDEIGKGTKFPKRKEELPRMKWKEFEERTKGHRQKKREGEGEEGEKKEERGGGVMPWIVIDGLVLDTGLYEDHPGGQHYLRLYYGRDATKAFRGGINLHTSAAETLMNMYAIATIEKEEEEEEAKEKQNKKEE